MNHHTEREITRAARHILDACGRPDLASQVGEVIDLLDESLPARKRFRGPAIMADMVAWHVLKLAGQAVNHAAFKASSAAGTMPVASRPWLLSYQAHVPVAAVPRPDPAAMLARLHARYPRVCDLATSCLPAVVAAVPASKPAVQAGIAILLACHETGRAFTRDMADIAGSAWTSPAINALRRLAARGITIDTCPRATCRMPPEVEA